MFINPFMLEMCWLVHMWGNRLAIEHRLAKYQGSYRFGPSLYLPHQVFLKDAFAGNIHKNVQ